MSERTRATGMAQCGRQRVASFATLSGVALLPLVVLACGGGDEGPPGSVQGDCQDYAEAMAAAAELDDPFLSGVITVGFRKGLEIPEAAQLLRAADTSYFFPPPYQEFAIVCVKSGYEDEWVARLREHPDVEWAHKEGVRPFLIED